MHTFFEVNGIENLNFIRFIHNLPILIPYWLPVFHLWGTSLQHLSAFHQNR